MTEKDPFELLGLPRTALLGREELERAVRERGRTGEVPLEELNQAARLLVSPLRRCLFLAECGSMEGVHHDPALLSWVMAAREHLAEALARGDEAELTTLSESIKRDTAELLEAFEERRARGESLRPLLLRLSYLEKLEQEAKNALFSLP